MEKSIEELESIIKAKDKIIAELMRDMDGTLRELNRLRDIVEGRK